MIKRAPDPELGARLRSAKLRRVDSMEDAGELMTWLGSRRPVLGVDTETTGLEWNCRLRTVQVGDGSAGWLIPWDDWAGLAREVLGKYAGRMAIWNAAYDVPVLSRHGIHLPQHLVDDPMLLAHLDDSSWSAAQKRRAAIHLDANAALLQETLDAGMRRHGWGWDTVPYTWAPAWMYGALDPVEAALMWELYRPVAEAHADVFDVLQASSWALTRASMHGTRIDVEYAQTYGEQLDVRAVECLGEAQQRWGLTSLGSSAAIAAILEADGVELSARTASGAPSITKDVLQGLADKHPLAALVLSYRHASKFRAAYVDGVLSRLDGDLVHPSIRAVGARTGRTSVSAPPLQQIPAGDPEPRRMFIPREGRVLLSVDMSAIEVRILAHLAGKGTLTSAFERGEDPHLATAARMYGESRAAEMRKKAKAATFSKVYGAGPKTVSIQQGISQAAAKKFLNEYYTAMPEVDTLINNLQRAGRERGRQDGRGWTQTGRGRIIWLSEAEEGYGQHYKLTNYCLAPDTPILTSDLRHVPARTVAVGDRLVGFDEHRSPERGRAGHRKFRVAEVEAVSRVVKPCVELEFSNGKSVICSTDHQWLVRRAAQNVRYTWARTDELRPDDEFLDIGTWEYDPHSRDAGYVAGCLDGEGSMTARAAGYRSTGLHFSQKPGAVMDSLVAATERLGIPGRYSPRSPRSTSPCDNVVWTAVPTIMRALGVTRPARFMPRAESLYDGAAMAGGERLFGHPTVIACRSVGDVETVSIQTSTRTLIANGLLSHNCIQGTAADITHTATALLAADGVTDGRLLLAVHDELLFDVAPDEVDEITEQVKTAFGTAGQLAGLSIPVVCDAEVYDTSWAQSVTG